MQAEISQSKLKWSDDKDISIFSSRVLNFINPKFNDEHEAELAEVELFSFAKKCELTANEFILALELASDGKLISEPDELGVSSKVKLFREIDRIKLGEVKSAYIYFKKIDKQHENGKAEISAFLEPPKIESSPEEKKEVFLTMCRNEYARLGKDGSVIATTVFYDYIRKNGIDNIKISWIEKLLDRYKPETFESGLSTSKVGGMLDLPKKVKHDAKSFFIDQFVRAYFEKEKLNQLSEFEFVNYWKNIYDKIQNTKQ